MSPFSTTILDSQGCAYSDVLSAMRFLVGDRLLDVSR